METRGNTAEGWSKGARALRVPLGVGLATAALYFIGLGRIPLVESSEGFHVAIAHEMVARGDWITPHFDGIRYFDKPPLLYWLMGAAFRLAGVAEWSARFWSALAVVATASLTAWLGARVGSERLGAIAGLMVAANMEVFLYGRLAKPDSLFVFFILLAFAGFILAHWSASRRAWLVCCMALGATVMAKDFLGAVGPLVVFALFLLLTRERVATGRWVPWVGVGVFVLLVAPWHLAMELRNPGFLWYMIVDNHVLNVTRLRAFPDEDIPLRAVEFLAVTAVGFFPWSLAVPWGIIRAFRPPWRSAEARVWLLLGLWGAGFLAALTASSFKLAYYGLPAFPALALLAARAWDDALARRAGAPSARALLAPSLVILVALAALCAAAWGGVVLLPSDTLLTVDLHSRNASAHGQSAPFIALDQVRSVLLPAATLVFGLGSVGIGVALLRGRPALGLGVLLAVSVAFLPLAAQGLALVSERRSARPITEMVKTMARPGDVVVHEGALENTGSLVAALDRPVRIVRGTLSNLAFGATFPEATEIFWDTDRLRRAWAGPERVFLVSVVKPEHSVARELPAGRTHLLLSAGGRWLYVNRSETPVR